MRPETALNKVAALCSRKEYCIADIRKKLTGWEIPEQEIEKILSFLINRNFINEERYIRAYINDKYHYSGWGKEKIREMLRYKGIPREMILAALEELKNDDYIETCRTLLKKKLKTIKHTDPRKVKASLIRFAAGRGFDYDTIRKAMELIDFRF